ncbi:hypothetical protein HK097_008759 [Rhizophlyctis rosea]|uniref:Endonuclease/exonuclease/phosphatase domain-containing protein n=1 Tax=Rhizophlyctis rosea TaxID=64517 RepID=A0AAD5S9V8_9FUNG|nr:hypothetical protein HK097_008759 [Rhizophlyctis rosea]
MSTLTICTFNIRFGSAKDGVNAWDKRRDILFRTIDRINPDILCVQEAEQFQINEILAGVTCTKFGCIGEGRNGGAYGEHTPIFYNTSRLAVDQSDTFWLTDGDSTRTGPPAWGANLPRITTWASFRLLPASASRFLVFNTHLDNESPSAREHSTSMIVKRIRDLSTPDVNAAFVTGDFNNLSSSANELEVFREDGFFDTFEATMNRPTEDRAPSFGTFHGFTGRAYSSIPKIDFVWLKRLKEGMEVREAGIIRDGEQGLYPSDHFAVYTVVQVAK